MDRRGGCCIARYAGGGGKMELIMQRFRPIAPKPTASGGGSSSAAERVASDTRGCIKTGRRRRRCNRKKRCSSPKKSGGKLPGVSEVHDNTVVTLPLLPERPDLTAGRPHGQNSVEEEEHGCERTGQTDLLARGEKAVIWLSVIVECVTTTWVDEAVLGRTDEEKMRRLEEDTCPGFISDGWNRVCWINRAFKRMARKTASLDEGWEEDMVVWVVMRETVVPVTCQAYTCRVRVQSTWKGRPGCCASSVTLPCDAWRMMSGGFAWRLDDNAALRLGR